MLEASQGKCVGQRPCFKTARTREGGVAASHNEGPGALAMDVLIAEDSAVYRKLLSGHLQDWGFSLTIAKDGAEAWDLLQRPDCPKLALLDWVLPEIDGIELCRRIRSAGTERAYTYVILLTGKSNKDDLLEAMEAGTDDYLVKP